MNEKELRRISRLKLISRQERIALTFHLGLISEYLGQIKYILKHDIPLSDILKYDTPVSENSSETERFVAGGQQRLH